MFALQSDFDKTTLTLASQGRHTLEYSLVKVCQTEPTPVVKLGFLKTIHQENKKKLRLKYKKSVK